MSQENMWMIGHPELDISTVEIISVLKWGNKQTRQNYKKSEIILDKCRNIPGMSPRNLRKICPPELELSLYLYNICKEVRQLTDWRTYKKFRIIWNWYANIPDASPKNFREISHPQLEISLYWHNFSKKVHQLTYIQTYNKYRYISNNCTNIPGMYP